MQPQASTTFVFDDPDRKGTVTVKPGGYGLDIEVTDGETTWCFLVDLFYLAPSGMVDSAGPDNGSVQIVVYHPQDHDGDPLKHVQVWPDGKVQVQGA